MQTIKINASLYSIFVKNIEMSVLSARVINFKFLYICPGVMLPIITTLVCHQCPTPAATGFELVTLGIHVSPPPCRGTAYSAILSITKN